MSPGLLVHPQWLPGALALLGGATLAVACARAIARRRRQRLGPHIAPGLSLTRDAALLLALATIGAALLGPRLGEKEVRVPASGIDLVLLVDVSRSMDARDVAPSRLARARRAGEELLARLAPGDRVALAFFAGRGVLVAPLTPDREAVAQLLEALDTDLLRPASSNLAAGLRAASAAFETGSERPRTIFVLSDGEDPERRGELGTAAALRAEAVVFAAAFGSDAGATVPDRGLPLRDREGSVVLSRRRAERLERLTRATGGRLYRADEWGHFDSAAAVASLRRGSIPDAEGMATRRVRALQVWPCAALAFVLLVMEGLPRGGRRSAERKRATPRGRRGAERKLAAPRGRRGATPKLAGLTAAVLLLSGAAGDDPAGLAVALRERPGDPRLLIELGLDRLERGRRVEAMRAFRAAAVGSADAQLAALAWYDLGVAALEAGSLEDARAAFFESLALAPGDREARFNLEWTQAVLEQQPPPTPTPLPAQAPPPEPEGEPEEGESPEPATEPEASREPSAEQRRRWLERVEDDLGRALRAAARESGEPRRSGPHW